MAEDAGGLAPSPGDSGPRSAHVRPVFERRRHSGQSGPGQPCGGQRIPRSARRPPARAGSPRAGDCLGCLVGAGRGGGTARADRRAAGGIRHGMVHAGTGLQGFRAPAARGCNECRCGGGGLAGIRRLPRRASTPAGGSARCRDGRRRRFVLVGRPACTARFDTGGGARGPAGVLPAAGSPSGTAVALGAGPPRSDSSIWGWTP